jgi:hypothetical protein
MSGLGDHSTTKNTYSNGVRGGFHVLSNRVEEVTR